MKLKTKWMLCMVWLLSLALGIGGTMLLSASFETALTQEREALLQSYRITSSVLEATVHPDTGDTMMQSIRSSFSQLEQVMDWSAWELKLDGQVIYQSGVLHTASADPPDTGSYRMQIVAIEGTQPGYAMELRGGIQAEESRLILTLARDVTSVYESRHTMLSAFRTIYLATVLIGSLVSLAMASALTAPLSKVSNATKQMAQGKLSVRLNLRRADEVGQLARDFDHMAAQLQESMKKMEQTMQAQARFMGSFAHELKTPMTSIIGYADLLRSQALPPEDAQAAANYIFTEGKRLESLSFKLLQLHLSKHELPELEPVEMDAFLRQLIGQLTPIYESEGIHLTATLAPGQWHLDCALMESVLINLLDNARKAMDSGGTITVKLDFPGNNCRIQVADDGRGMPPEVLQHLTEAFYRVDTRSRAQGGAGLGLSLCDEIVQRHNGTLRFQSQPGNGTRVTILLKGVLQ